LALELNVRGGTSVTANGEPALLEAKERPRSQKRRLPRGEVHIFDNWCKGCSLCIEFCPAGVLVLGIDNRPKPIYPEKCTACRWCELHCPDFAIFITELPDDDESSALQAESCAP
jgi:2-oxoglutarate ferredoxin oxidoreductase subunit delta